MAAFYNEIDPYAAQWLRNLIAAGHIAPGVVDTRSIEDINPDELHGFTQCHFFAGIGVWSHALRLAGWDDTRPCWTGSCPCQPFSSAGKGSGFADERHLWPAFYYLIEQCRPATVFGEQVASADGLQWLDLVSADLEGSAYAVGAADLCAAGVGAPHIRQRLYWVADADDASKHALLRAWSDHSDEDLRGGTAVRPERQMAAWNKSKPREFPGRYVDPAKSHTAWSDADQIRGRDGLWRPVEPGTFPLAHGNPEDLGRQRAYGNAIVPQVAATFITAYLHQSVA